MLEIVSDGCSLLTFFLVYICRKSTVINNYSRYINCSATTRKLFTNTKIALQFPDNYFQGFVDTVLIDAPDMLLEVAVAAEQDLLLSNDLSTRDSILEKLHVCCTLQNSIMKYLHKLKTCADILTDN